MQILVWKKSNVTTILIIMKIYALYFFNQYENIVCLNKDPYPESFKILNNEITAISEI